MTDITWIDILIQLLISLIGGGIGAVIGAYFGLRLARGWDREKRKEEIKQTKIRMLDAIIEELRSFQQMVDPKSINPVKLDWNPSSRDFIGYHISVSTPAFKSAVNAGDFSLLPSTLQTQLGNLYLTLDDCKLYNDHALNFYSTPIFSSNSTTVNREATRICTNFNDKISRLRDQIEEILPKLESAKTDDQKSITI